MNHLDVVLGRLATALGAEPPAVEAAFDRWLSAGREAHPQVALEPTTFARCVAERAPEGLTLAAFDEALRAADLYLACACVAGDETAIRVFERHCSPELRHGVLASKLSPDLADEVTQQLCARLLVGDGDGAAPRLSLYSGRGSLTSWLRVTALREALMTLRQARREAPLDDAHLDRMAAPSVDPEVHYVKTQHRELFQQALRASFDGLDARLRGVLRCQYLDGLTQDQTAAMYGVHRVTVARWQRDAKVELLARTRAHLETRLALSPSELLSLWRAVQSQLDVSVRGLLATRRGEDDLPPA